MEKKINLKKITKSREASLVIVLIVLCAVAGILSPAFLTVSNMLQIFRNNALTLIMALGMLCVLLTGGIDISISSVLAFAGMTVGMLMKHDILHNTFLLFVIALLIGLACGMINGLIISKARVAPIICTMGFMYIWRGLAYVISNNTWASAEQVGTFADFGKKGAPGPYILIIAAYVIFFMMMKWTQFGRKIYAVGSNREAAKISGINVDWVLIRVYMIMGMLSGLCGALSVSIYASAQPNMQEGLEMDVIAACVIGGVSMNGGRGSVIGTLLGAVIIAFIAKALPLVGIDSIAQNTAKGVIILAVVLLNCITQRTMAKNNLERREI